MEYQIFKSTCLATGLSYIGQQNAYADNSKYFGGGSKLKQAIAEHGLQTFTKEIIAEDITDIDDLNSLLASYISEYNTLWPHGYNSMSKGNIRELSLEARQRISRANKGRRSPRKGVIVSEETRRKQSLARQGRKLKRNPVEILDTVTGEVMVFDGVQAAANYFGVTQGYISLCKKDKTKVIKGRFTTHP